MMMSFADEKWDGIGLPLIFFYSISISPTLYLFEKQYTPTLLSILSLFYLNIFSLFFYKFKYYIFYSFSLLIFLLRPPTPPSKTQQQPPLHQDILYNRRSHYLYIFLFLLG
jgi:hypothetical protein